MIRGWDGERGDVARLLCAMDRLSDSDQQVVVRLVRHIADVEAEHGEATALAVTEQMQGIIQGRLAA